MMTISIVASGTRGDVQPYIALGAGLKEAGYRVQVLTTEDFEGLVKSAGLEFCSTGTSVEAMLQSPEWREVTEKGNFLTILSRMTAEMKRRANDLALNVSVLFEGTDLILTGVSGMGGGFSIGEKLGIPVIQAYVFPFTPTSAFPSPLAAGLPLPALFNRFSFHVMRQMLWQSVRAADMSTRRELGMSPGSFWGPYRSLNQKRGPIVYGYSKHVLSRPADWESNIDVTGYWFLEAPSDWSPPPDLASFLNAGSPPVYIGFGSMGSQNPEEATTLALKALALSGQRGVLASGWGGLSQANLPDTVHMMSSSPHSWLFPQMAAVVHHGGAGTTAAGLRAGIPSIIVPFFGDQPFWGQRVAALGVGPKPLPRRKLTAEGLAQAITQAVSDTAVRQQAAALGEKIRAEGGIGRVVSLVGRLTRS